MSRQADTAAEERLLLELAELGMGVSRQLHKVALETTDAPTLAAVGTAFHHVSRGVRQSLALRARFAAGTVAPERTARPEPAAAPAAPSAPRFRRDTESLGWNEHERLDCDELLEDLDVVAERPEGEAQPLDAARDRIRRDLTVVSRTPPLYAIPALRPQANKLAGRAALLSGAALRIVNSS